MRIYETCYDGNRCTFNALRGAKDMLLCNIKYSEEFTEEEYHKYEKEINELTEGDLENEPYHAKEYSLEIGGMNEEEFNNLPEFEGY
ncbi:hypothetical protein [Abyssisolibacter fermentans]|uniref:hypothetical protein n=1 Tax=Abyssisolibacter fermentans TaxID=1766203 RepID=UPI000832E176|nr:hypothetical protein [Abyssisolibacter fermentans]